MKRIFVFLSVLLALTGTALVSVQATQESKANASVLVCTTRTNNSSSPGSWTFITPASWWRMGPLQATPSCGGYVTYVSRGWRFDGTQCGQVWVRRPLPGGGTYIVPGSVKYMCGGETEVIVSRCSCPHFWVETWVFPTTDRHHAYWPIGVVRF